MAVTGIFDNNLTAPKKDTSKFSTLSNNLNGGLFSNIKTGENKTGDAVVSNVNDMLSGDSYDAYKAQANQKLSRAIANLRNSVGTQYGGSVGQGSYNKARQGAEQSIFSQMADNNLQADVEKNAMKERGITAAQNLAQAEATNSQNNMQTAMASDTAYGYTDQFGNKIRGSNELAGKQVDIAQQNADTNKELGYAQIGSSEKIAGMNITSSEKISANQLNETARQFNITNDTDKQQFAATMKLNYDQLSETQKQFLMNFGLDEQKFNQAKSEYSQNLALNQQQFAATLKKDYAALSQQEKQFLANFGLDEAKFNQAKSEFTQNIALEQQKLLSNEKIATAQLGLDAQKLAETARQFNISTSEAAKQFTDKLNFDYTSLSQNDKQFLANLGLDQAKFEESKRQYNNTTALEDKWRTKDLDLKEQSLAQEASQFTSRIEYDKWATQAGLDDAAANRIWQATQNDKALQNAKDVQQMVINQDQWKQNKVDELTQYGWSLEEAKATADRQQQLTIANMQNALTRDIEAGRIDQADRELLQQANQFNTQQLWTERAAQIGIDEAKAQRIWATNERISTEAANAIEATRERQLQREIATNNLNLEQAKLVAEINQFNSKSEFEEYAFDKGLDENAANRLWQTNERIENNIFQTNLQKVTGELQLSGVKYQTMLNYLETIDEDQAYGVLQAVALDAGLSYVVTDKNTGLPIKDKSGKVVTEKGFPPTNTDSSQKGFDLMQEIESGELSATTLRGGKDKNNPSYADYQKLLETADFWKPELVYDSRGFWAADQRYIKNAPAKGTVFVRNNTLYQVLTDKELSKKGDNSDEFKVLDIASGQERTIRVSGKSGATLKIEGF